MIKESFRKYLEEAIGCDNAAIAFSAFEKPASVSLRLNPFKAGGPEAGRTVGWSPWGRMLEERPVFTLDPLFHAGAYYVQDSSSMFVGHVFRQMLAGPMSERLEAIRRARPVRVLDLCAAPGGKTTDLAASLRECFGDDFILVSNEVMKQRVGILADNVALWGDPNVVVTSDDPSAFGSLPGFFDLVVTDVPCSGEGMFRKDEEAQAQWSEDNVALCASRQRRILADVWPSLAEGGMLIYSTCTFNRLENDENVLWIADELGGECLNGNIDTDAFPGIIRTDCGFSLVPGFVEGEGQYCAVVRKTSAVRIADAGRTARQMRPASVPQMPSGLFIREMTYRMRGERIIAVPANLMADLQILEQYLHVIAAGCAAGVFKGKTFVPDADLALSVYLAPDAFPSVEVDRQTALAFLHKDSISLPGEEKGYMIIRHAGLALGFVKNIGNRCNNLHPQSRRIRINIY